MQRPFRDWGGNLVAFAIVILLNFLSNALPINGQTMPEISAKYPSLFTPAGFTFAIWGAIYLGLLVFVIWQALPAQRSSDKVARLSILVPDQLPDECGMDSRVALRPAGPLAAGHVGHSCDVDPHLPHAYRRYRHRAVHGTPGALPALQPVRGMDNPRDNRECQHPPNQQRLGLRLANSGAMDASQARALQAQLVPAWC